MASSSFTILTILVIFPPKDHFLNPLHNQYLLKTLKTQKHPKLSCKCKFSAQNQPAKHKQKGKYQTEKPESDVNPVGFLSKYGINDRDFDQFLRERHKAYEDRKFEILSRFISLHEAAAGYEIMGMHRYR